MDTAQAARPTLADGTPADAGDAGYGKDLKARHVNMIAIGGAIGTGLFLGAGGRLHHAGPALAIGYLVCGIFAFFVVRALGELVLHRPSSGSFVSYAREFLGEKGGYAAGWMYFLNLTEDREPADLGEQPEAHCQWQRLRWRHVGDHLHPG